ncbi:uncharacterized protein A1O9_00273 [Exophiala aquamarina CBS 119918]|uniref:Uncharacterized protein n=1 Tax=Exophiala aquamarina CBS 119918 TaxID=1182545 RepID=A0A072PR29_9EURO|nr:uncharacterized protein A1O9_00273 [Exophiala aquamarina CBS 119918]KEF62301.1 hypothetical protein A1O9_00273 [Exophiala aquamarina CBS 119918]
MKFHQFAGVLHGLRARMHKFHAQLRLMPRPVHSQSAAMEEDAEPEYISRTGTEEIDTVAVSPVHPEYMVTGTYSLLASEETPEYEAQVRKGSLEILLVTHKWMPRYAGMLPPNLEKISFSCAIPDIHFHPTDGSLLGVATSTGYVHFFRFYKHGDVLGRRVDARLLPMGFAKVADADEHGLKPLVTQFTWSPEISTHGVTGIDDFHRAGLAFTSSFGNTSYVIVEIPAIRDVFDHRLAKEVPELTHMSAKLHKHELEAWTVAAVTLRSSYDTFDRLVFSGGDDSALMATSVQLPNTTSPSFNYDDVSINTNLLWRDRRSHGAGVVAILPLPAMHVPRDTGMHGKKEILPLLTGSYDETLRIFEIDMVSYRPVLQKEMKFAGGVWRLKVLDEYSTITTDQGELMLLEHEEEHTALRTKHFGGQLEHHTLIVVSLMHAGAMIIRVTYTRGTDLSGCSWSITPLQRFRDGHESMVYCCAARLEPPPVLFPRFSYKAVLKSSKPRREGDDDARCPTYTVVSTSFYDKKICTWKFIDRFKGRAQLKPIDCTRKNDDTVGRRVFQQA